MSDNESVMDLCAEWRECIEAADPSVWNDARIAGLVKTTKAQQLAYLDRIEAAWKREKAEWEAAACAFVSDAVMSGKVAVEHPPVGNAAAMREALVKIRKVLDRNSINSPVSWLHEEVDRFTNAALSKPPRVCDVNTLESLSDFVEKTILTSDLLKDIQEIVKSIVMASVRTALTVAYEPAKRK